MLLELKLLLEDGRLHAHLFGRQADQARTALAAVDLALQATGFVGPVGIELSRVLLAHRSDQRLTVLGAGLRGEVALGRLDVELKLGQLAIAVGAHGATEQPLQFGVGLDSSDLVLRVQALDGVELVHLAVEGARAKPVGLSGSHRGGDLALQARVACGTALGLVDRGLERVGVVRLCHCGSVGGNLLLAHRHGETAKEAIDHRRLEIAEHLEALEQQLVADLQLACLLAGAAHGSGKRRLLLHLNAERANLIATLRHFLSDQRAQRTAAAHADLLHRIGELLGLLDQACRPTATTLRDRSTELAEVRGQRLHRRFGVVQLLLGDHQSAIEVTELLGFRLGEQRLGLKRGDSGLELLDVAGEGSDLRGAVVQVLGDRTGIEDRLVGLDQVLLCGVVLHRAEITQTLGTAGVLNFRVVCLLANLPRLKQHRANPIARAKIADRTCCKPTGGIEVSANCIDRAANTPGDALHEPGRVGSFRDIGKQLRPRIAHLLELALGGVGQGLELLIHLVRLREDRGEHLRACEFTSRAHRTHLAHGLAQPVGDRLGERRHVLHDRAQFVAVQTARGQRLRQLDHAAGDLATARARDQAQLLHSLGERLNLRAGGSQRLGVAGKAQERIGSGGKAGTGLLRALVELVHRVSGGIGRAESVLEAGLHQGGVVAELGER